MSEHNHHILDSDVRLRKDWEKRQAIPCLRLGELARMTGSDLSIEAVSSMSFMKLLEEFYVTIEPNAEKPGKWCCYDMQSLPRSYEHALVAIAPLLLSGSWITVEDSDDGDLYRYTCYTFRNGRVYFDSAFRIIWPKPTRLLRLDALK